MVASTGGRGFVAMLAARPTARAHMAPDGAERLLLGMFACGWSIAAMAFWNVRGFETFLPAFWPWFYVAAALSCWWFLLRPQDRLALILSGGLSFVAVLSRAGGVAVYLIRGQRFSSPWYGVLGLVIYPLFAAALLFVWRFGMSEMWAEHRHRLGETARDPAGV